MDVELREALTEGFGPEPGPWPTYEERSALVDALQQLSAMQRKTVVLRHMVGLSVAETADELGISEGTVKSHRSRGLAALEKAVLATEH
jgi:RNA polymerase sigma factor (sigma-70 family)